MRFRVFSTEPKPRRLEREQASKQHRSSTRPASLQPHHSLPPPPSPLVSSPSVSSRRRHLPLAFRWRRTLLSVFPSSHSCTTHPPTPAGLVDPIPEHRLIQPLPAATACNCYCACSFGLSGCHTLLNESVELRSFARTIQTARPREPDLLGLPATYSLSLLQPQQDRDDTALQLGDRTGIEASVTGSHAKQVLKEKEAGLAHKQRRKEHRLLYGHT